jgi:hypothetical protein
MKLGSIIGVVEDPDLSDPIALLHNVDVTRSER